MRAQCIMGVQVPGCPTSRMLKTEKNLNREMEERTSREAEPSVASAVQALVAVLQRHVQPSLESAGQGQAPNPQVTSVQPRERIQGPAVQHEMARSFPGFFQKKSCLGKRRFQCSKNVPKQPKHFSCTVYLLQKNAQFTPSPSGEMQLALAGLGKRQVDIIESMDHNQVSIVLGETFSKFKNVSGGWVVKKALGGHGRRSLTVVPPSHEGYTGAQLKSTTFNGKTALFVVPLQEELDMKPLPSDAEEYKLMPKATCKSCMQEMPLQLLTNHVESCTEDLIHVSESETLSDGKEDDMENYSSEAETSFQPLNVAKAACPICHKMFPESELLNHASTCGDTGFENSVPIPSADLLEVDKISCEEDVLRWLVTQLDRSKEFHLCISRENLLERGIMQWQRQKKASPLNPLKVSFLGEAGVDTGALRLEFLTEMVAGLEERLFVGENKKGKIPKYSMSDLHNGLFRVAGQVFAASLAQGGPAPKFLQEWCFSFLATGCITVDKKEEIIRAILMHATMQRTPMLNDLREGLNLYNFMSVLQQKTEHCRGLFVFDNDDKVDAHYIISNLDPQMSEEGTLKHSKEIHILNCLQDFLNEIEDEPLCNEDQPTVAKIMQWLTGQSHRHLLLSDRRRFKIYVHFNHNCQMSPFM
uniref:HECT domain-containing protein n=1 Tax=Knipowitschia caucasica TaxID=637954 RepID=A0AAV2JTL2_KNICA